MGQIGIQKDIDPYDLEIEAAPPAEAPPPIPAEVEGTAHAHGFTPYDTALLGMAVLWAANPTALKWALGYMEPLAFNALRFALAALLPLAILLLNREKLTWHKGDGLKLLLFGLLGHGVYQTMFIIALDNTLAGNVALILSVNPAFVAIFSALFGYERIRNYAWVGIGLTLAGVAFVVLGSGEKLELGHRLFGDLIMVGVTLIWGLYTVLSQPLLKRYSSVQLNALMMPVGAVTLLVIAAPSLARSVPTWPTAPWGVWLVLAASGLFALSASYIIWYKGIQKLGATRTAVYTNLVPVLAGLIAYFFLGEPLGWQFWTGMLLVLAGVSLARFGGRVLQMAAGSRY